MSKLIMFENYKVRWLFHKFQTSQLNALNYHTIGHLDVLFVFPAVCQILSPILINSCNISHFKINVNTI